MAVRTVSDPSAIRPPARHDSPASQDEYGPLGPVFRLGHRIAPVGLAIGLTIGLSTHGIASARALALGDLRHWWRDSQAVVRAYYFTTYDVDISDAKPAEKAPEAEPEPEKEPEKEPDKDAVPPPAVKPEEDPYKDAPPPKPAEAAQVVTAPDNGQAPLDGFDTQSGKDPNGALDGKTAADGSGKDTVRDPRASTSGTPKGTGTTPGATGNKPSAGPDLSRPPTLVGSTSWNCPFPAEADAEGRDSATATIVVTVRADGSPQSVSVVADPGAGFGRAARQCALGRRYQPALDRAGSATSGTTPPIRVRFSR